MLLGGMLETELIDIKPFLRITVIVHHLEKFLDSKQQKLRTATWPIIAHN